MEQSARAELAGPEKEPANSHFSQVWLVLALALIFGAALATVQVNLSEVIAANKLNETLERVPELVQGDAAAGKPSNQDLSLDIAPGTATIKKDGKTATYPLFQVTRKGKAAGWVIKARGQGYADKIEILLGLDAAAETITGLFVLEQKETPGLGNKIIFPQWRDQFVGKKAGSTIEVNKGKGLNPRGIDAISGATISSRSVTAIVNQTLADINANLTPETIRFSERPL